MERPTSPPKVSVVIVSWNSRDVLLECLASLAAHPPAVSWEAIVVDNASTDGSVDAVRRSAPWAQVIANRDNRGLAAGNNQGMLAARGDAVLISNPDVVYTEGAIAALYDLLERRPRAAFAVARLLNPDGSVQTAAGDLPTLGDALRGRQAARARSKKTTGTTTGFWWDSWAHDDERSIGHGGEACYLVRKAAVLEIGPQDERYRLDWEGIDWSARAWDSGWEVWFCPAAEVVHAGGVSIRQDPMRWVVRSHRGMYRYFADRRPPWMRPALAAAFAGRTAVKLAVAAVGAPLHEWGVRGRQ